MSNSVPAVRTITQDDLRWLVCPVCRQSLQLHPPATVSCTACGRSYPIVDGLPVLIPTPPSKSSPGTCS